MVQLLPVGLFTLYHLSIDIQLGGIATLAAAVVVVVVVR